MDGGWQWVLTAYNRVVHGGKTVKVLRSCKEGVQDAQSGSNRQVDGHLPLRCILSLADNCWW
jgi:hypothetical protein